MAVQFKPSSDVITLLLLVPESATAQNNPSSSAQHTILHAFASTLLAVTQSNPSGETMTLVLLTATAQNRDSDDDQQTEDHERVLTPEFATTQL